VTAPKPTKSTPDGTPSLIDWVLVALLNLGGAAQFVDIEDLAMEAYRLAPQRFCWRRYAQPSLEAVRVAAKDANHPGRIQVLGSRNGRERMLTALGAARAEQVAEQMELHPPRPDQEALRRRATSDLARIEAHPAYQRWLTAGWVEVDAIDLADIARCAISTDIPVFQARLLQLQAEAAHWEQPSLERFFQEASERLVHLLGGAMRP
jgi:hypothetical protein